MNDIASLVAFFALIAAACAAYIGYRSGSRQAARAEKAMQAIVSDNALRQRFEEANNMVFAIQDGIKHGRLSQQDRDEIVRKLQQVEKTYGDVIRFSEAHSA